MVANEKTRLARAFGKGPKAGCQCVVFLTPLELSLSLVSFRARATTAHHMITASKHIFLKRSSDQWAVGRQLMKRKLTTAQQPTPTPQAWDSFAGWLFLASSDMGLWSYLLSHWRSINEKIPKTVRALARECCVWALAHGLSWSPHNIRPGTVPFLSSPWSGSRARAQIQ